LFQELVRTHSNPNDVIVDPFGGSGTTYIASLLEGRRCISVEKDTTQFERTLERIEHYEHPSLNIS